MLTGMHINWNSALLGKIQEMQGNNLKCTNQIHKYPQIKLNIHENDNLWVFN